MDRRDVLGLFGTTGAGLALGGLAGAAEDHPSGPDTPGAVGAFHLHFCGIHIAKKSPKFQLVAHHYCGPLGDIHQCLLFDSSKKHAKLLGVEYIIPDTMYRKLPEEEKKYWHPHTYEVLAGGLTAPGMKPEDEMKFMKAILTTWGKSWHTWPDPSTAVPLGEPLLMWSVTGDGQIDEKVLAARDRELGVSAEKIRESRCKELGYEVPKVSLPRSVDSVGRQWTDNGDDRPTPKK